MMTSQGPRRGGLVWAIVGGLVLVAGIIAIVVTAIISQAAPSATSPPEPGAGSTGPTPSESRADDGEFVDPSVSDLGWVPEPITSDPGPYIRAALEAASTFDTTRSSREDWLDYLDSWFTPDTRYTSEEDQAAAMDASQVEMRQGVVLRQEEWDSLANEDGRVTALASGELAFVAVPEDPSGDMSIGTADVTLTFTRSDGSGAEASYEESVRVSVQVLCGVGSVPTPNTPQRAGDCKVVRYFTETLEP